MVLDKITSGEAFFLAILLIIATASVLIAFAEALKGRTNQKQRAGDQASRAQTGKEGK